MEYYIFIIMLFVGVGNAYINMNPYKQQILDLHNNVRRMEPAANMQLMRWNTQLENEATMWAGNCMFDHQQAGRGENLAMHTAPWDYAQLITTGITMWADEKQQYTYGSSGFSSATGHYTQMVWAETTDVGCGMTRCPSLSMGGGTPMHDAWFFVCFYTPPGNFIGQLPYISGQQCSQCNRGQHCDMGLCSDYPGGGGAPGGQLGGGGGGGAPGGHMGGGGAPGGQMGGGGGAQGGQMGGSGGAPSGQMGGGGGAPGGHAGGGGATGGHMGSGGGAPGGHMGGGGGSGGHAGGSPGGQMGAGPTQSSQHGGGPSSAGNMGVIGGGPGMPQIQFINGFPHISLGTPTSGGAGSNQPTGSGNQPTGSGANASGPSGSGVVSKNPAGSITIWGFQGGSQNKPRGGGGGAGGCTDQPWCSMWVELCADPKYSTKIARDCPVSCGQCPPTAGGPGQGGQGGGPACVDAIEGCVFWKQIGMCHIPFFQTYITETCARTCNMC